MRRLLTGFLHRSDLLRLDRDGRLASLVFPLGLGLGDALALPLQLDLAIPSLRRVNRCRPLPLPTVTGAARAPLYLPA